MCNSSFNSALDEQRMLYMYQGFNIVFKLLSQYLDANEQAEPTLAEAHKNADAGSVIGMAFMALKNGNITQAQYDQIFDIAMGMKTVQTTATTEPSWNEQYKSANKFLNQYRR